MSSPNHAPTPTLQNTFGNALRVGQNISTLSFTMAPAALAENLLATAPSRSPRSRRFRSRRLAGTLSALTLLSPAVALGVAEASTNPEREGDDTPDAPLRDSLRTGEHESVFDSSVAIANKSSDGGTSSAKLNFITGADYGKIKARYYERGCIPLINSPSNRNPISKHGKLKMHLKDIVPPEEKDGDPTTHGDRYREASIEKRGIKSKEICGFLGLTAGVPPRNGKPWIHGRYIIVHYNENGEFPNKNPINSGEETGEITAFVKRTV